MVVDISLVDVTGLGGSVCTISRIDVHVTAVSNGDADTSFDIDIDDWSGHRVGRNWNRYECRIDFAELILLGVGFKDLVGNQVDRGAPLHLVDSEEDTPLLP